MICLFLLLDRTKWKCDKCPHELTREYVKQVFTNARNDAMARCKYLFDINYIFKSEQPSCSIKI